MGLCRQRRKKMLRVTFDHWSKENKRVVQLLKTDAEIGWKKKKCSLMMICSFFCLFFQDELMQTLGCSLTFPSFTKNVGTCAPNLMEACWVMMDDN